MGQHDNSVSHYLTADECSLISMKLWSGDYSSKYHNITKRFLLTNPKEANNVSLEEWIYRFNGTGHSEWETLLAVWLVIDIRRSLDTKKDCDISDLFAVDLLASPTSKNESYRIFSSEEIYNHLAHIFKVVEETEQIVKFEASVK